VCTEIAVWIYPPTSLLPSSTSTSSDETVIL
jgi:hypothetical protein